MRPTTAGKVSTAQGAATVVSQTWELINTLDISRRRVSEMQLKITLAHIFIGIHYVDLAHQAVPEELTPTPASRTSGVRGVRYTKKDMTQTRKK